MTEGRLPSTARPATERFVLFRPPDAAAALGLAVNHLMVKPAFANLKFGEWSRILVGQINRRHYYFARDNQSGGIEGFMGWAITTRAKADAWVEGREVLSYQDSLVGDCLIFNAWSATSPAVHRFLIDQARQIFNDKATIYFKRHYRNRTSRPVRLNVNDFVTSHVERNRAAVTPRPSRS